jgi:hypothetical protein
MPPPARVAVLGARHVLVHAPGLVRHGSRPSRDLAREPSRLARLAAALRPFEAAAAYPPHRAFLGALPPEALWKLPRPWTEVGGPVEERGPYGHLLPETALYGLLKASDAFDLLWLTEPCAAEAQRALATRGLLSAEELARLGPGRPAGAVEARLGDPGALPLHLGDGRLVGVVQAAHPEDEALRAAVLLENLAAAATATAALRTLLADLSIDPGSVPYVLNAGEEAVGDRYQRGGGSLGKAVAERAGCTAASGADLKAFCCGPVHALVIAGALVAAGVFDRVAVVCGGSLAKLGMKYRGHLAAGLPVVEDVLAGSAALIGRDDGRSPRLRLDAVGRHPVAAGSAQEAILTELAVRPLERLGLRLSDVDKFATELHNPEATEPAGSGDVPRLNYRMLAALAARREEIPADAIDEWGQAHGLPGFAPTQGHIASAIPFLPHAVEALADGRLERAMFLAKGSLFLGRMTRLADGFSFLLEAPAR